MTFGTGSTPPEFFAIAIAVLLFLVGFIWWKTRD